MWLLILGCLPQDPSVDETRIHRLIETLAEDDFPSRSDAGEALIQIGKPALPALYAFLEGSLTPEVRDHARAVQNKILDPIIRGLESLPPPRGKGRSVTVSEILDGNWTDYFPECRIFKSSGHDGMTSIGALSRQTGKVYQIRMILRGKFYVDRFSEIGMILRPFRDEAEAIAAVTLITERGATSTKIGEAWIVTSRGHAFHFDKNGRCIKIESTPKEP